MKREGDGKIEWGQQRAWGLFTQYVHTRIELRGSPAARTLSFSHPRAHFPWVLQGAARQGQGQKQTRWPQTTKHHTDNRFEDCAFSERLLTHSYSCISLRNAMHRRVAAAEGDGKCACQRAGTSCRRRQVSPNKKERNEENCVELLPGTARSDRTGVARITTHTTNFFVRDKLIFALRQFLGNKRRPLVALARTPFLAPWALSRSGWCVLVVV